MPRKASTTPKQELKLKIDPSVPMTAFCYGYAKALLDKLLELESDGRLFESFSGDSISTTVSVDARVKMTGTASMVYRHLIENVGYVTPSLTTSNTTFGDYAEFVNNVGEFICIFDGVKYKKCAFCGEPLTQYHRC